MFEGGGGSVVKIYNIKLYFLLIKEFLFFVFFKKFMVYVVGIVNILILSKVFLF